MRCRGCGAEVQPSLTVCPECGANVQRFKLLRSTVHCRACEASVKADLNICPNCGAPLRRGWRPLLRMVLILSASAGLTYLAVNYVPWPALRALPGRIQVPSVAYLVTPTFTLRPSPSPTTTRTATRTRTPTATAVPPTSTLTPLPPTATQLPTPSSTPTPPFPAPRLLTPEDGTEFAGSSSQIVLSWESVGVLADDEWYGVSLRYLTDGVVQYEGTWTKDTSWQVPGELYRRAGQNEREFQWDVAVMMQTGTKLDGGREGMALGPTSEPSLFVWR